MSNTLESAPWDDHEIAVERGDGVDAVRRLRDQYAGDLIIWGSLTLTDALFRAGEVDVLRLRIVPTLIGAGRAATPDDLPPDRADARRNQGVRRRPGHARVRRFELSAAYFSSRDSTRSASGLPPVWHVGQYCRLESA